MHGTSQRSDQKIVNTQHFANSGSIKCHVLRVSFHINWNVFYSQFGAKMPIARSTSMQLMNAELVRTHTGASKHYSLIV